MNPNLRLGLGLTPTFELLFEDEVQLQFQPQVQEALSYVTASNSRHNPVELFAILIFGSDLGARFDSKLQHSAVLVRTQHCSGRILDPKSVRNRKSNRVQSWSSWFRCRSTLPTRPGLHSVGLPNEQILGLESAQSSAVFGPKTALCCSFESNRAPRSLPKIRIANSSTTCSPTCSPTCAPTLPTASSLCQKCFKFAPKRFVFVPNLGIRPTAVRRRLLYSILMGHVGPWGSEL